MRALRGSGRGFVSSAHLTFTTSRPGFVRCLRRRNLSVCRVGCLYLCTVKLHNGRIKGCVRVGHRCVVDRRVQGGLNVSRRRAGVNLCVHGLVEGLRGWA